MTNWLLVSGQWTSSFHNFAVACVIHRQWPPDVKNMQLIYLYNDIDNHIF